MRDLSKVWDNCGLATIEHVAQKNKELFFGVCARLIPQDVQITLEQNTGLDPNDLAVLRAIKEAIPNANSRSPSEVLEYVRDTLRAADAKVIDN